MCMGRWAPDACKKWGSCIGYTISERMVWKESVILQRGANTSTEWVKRVFPENMKHRPDLIVSGTTCSVKESPRWENKVALVALLSPGESKSKPSLEENTKIQEHKKAKSMNKHVSDKYSPKA